MAVRDALKPATELGFHGHHTLAMGVANSIAANEAGATRVDAAAAGLGAGAGNTPLEVLVAVCDRMGIATGVDVWKIQDVAEDRVVPIMDFPIRIDRDALTLGYAGQVSLARQQYYAQPQNAFWRVMGALFDAGLDVPYPERAERLRAQGVALWDVCKAATRPGSLDASIELASVVPNDFRRFFERHPRIGLVCTNGATATRLYVKLVVPALREPARSLRVHPLPSTSPAHASMRFAQKLERWSIVAAAVAGTS